MIQYLIIDSARLVQRMHEEKLTGKCSQTLPSKQSETLPSTLSGSLTSKHSQKILDMIEQFLVCADFYGTQTVLSRERSHSACRMQTPPFEELRKGQVDELQKQEDEMGSCSNLLIQSPKSGRNPCEEESSLMISKLSAEKGEQMNEGPKIFSRQIKSFFRQRLSFSEILEELSKCCANWKSGDKDEEETKQTDQGTPKLLYFFDAFSAPISRIELPAYHTFRVQQDKIITFMAVNQRQHQCCLIDNHYHITIYDTLNFERQIETANEFKEEFTVAKWDLDGDALLFGTKSGKLIMISAVNLKHIDSLNIHTRHITAIQENERYIYTSSKDQTLCKISRKAFKNQLRIRCCDFSCMAKLSGREYTNFTFGVHSQKQIVMVDQMLECESTIFTTSSHSSIVNLKASPHRHTLLISVSKKSPEIIEVNPFTSQSFKRITILTDNYREISSALYSEDVLAISFQSNKIKYYSLRSWKLLHTYEGDKNTKIDSVEAMYKHKQVFAKHEKGFSLYSTEIKEHVFLKFLPEKPRLRQTNIHFLSMLRSLGAAV